jgi:ABC-type transport system substrate-binding protein
MLALVFAVTALLHAGPAFGAGPATFTLAIQNFQHDTLDPALGEVNDLIYLSPLYDPLVGTASSGDLTPARGLASSWKTSPDAKKWTFTLRRNVRRQRAHDRRGRTIGLQLQRAV